MTLKQLEYAVTVEKYKNITKAAEMLYIAQPSLTHAINELENELNIIVFERTKKGVNITEDGKSFLGYAKQILEQSNLLLERYTNKKIRHTSFSVSCQHYSFCVTAFSETVKEFGGNTYDFTLRETMTNEIIDDVSTSKSEIGVLYLSNQNKEIISKLIEKKDLEFIPLIIASPHVFISKDHPLAKKDKISIEDLDDYPYLTFEQGENNSFYFSEEFISNIDVKKNIIVRDRATLFNLASGLNGYTVSSGIISKDVNEGTIISKPLIYDDVMQIGYIKHKNISLSKYGSFYVKSLKNLLNN